MGGNRIVDVNSGRGVVSDNNGSVPLRLSVANRRREIRAILGACDVVDDNGEGVIVGDKRRNVITRAIIGWLFRER